MFTPEFNSFFPPPVTNAVLSHHFIALGMRGLSAYSYFSLLISPFIVSIIHRVLFFFPRVALTGPRSVAMNRLHPCSHWPLFAIAPTHEWIGSIYKQLAAST